MVKFGCVIYVLQNVNITLVSTLHNNKKKEFNNVEERRGNAKLAWVQIDHRTYTITIACT